MLLDFDLGIGLVMDYSILRFLPLHFLYSLITSFTIISLLRTKFLVFMPANSWVNPRCCSTDLWYGILVTKPVGSLKWSSSLLTWLYRRELVTYLIKQSVWLLIISRFSSSFWTLRTPGYFPFYVYTSLTPDGYTNDFFVLLRFRNV